MKYCYVLPSVLFATLLNGMDGRAHQLQAPRPTIKYDSEWLSSMKRNSERKECQAQAQRVTMHDLTKLPAGDRTKEIQKLRRAQALLQRRRVVSAPAQLLLNRTEPRSDANRYQSVEIANRAQPKHDTLQMPPRPPRQQGSAAEEAERVRRLEETLRARGDETCCIVTMVFSLCGLATAGTITMCALFCGSCCKNFCSQCCCM